MTCDDSVQIAATSRARRRAFARMGRVERASGGDTIEDVASGPGRTPRGRWDRRRDRGGNIPTCKALKTHKTRKESRFCASPFMGRLNAPHTGKEGATREWRGSRAVFSTRLASRRRPVPIVDLLNRGDSVAGIAAREADGKRSRPEMAPQRLEKIKSAPGNAMASEASNPPDLVHRRTADRAQERQSRGETAKPSAPCKALKTHKCGKKSRPGADSPTSPNCSRAR